MSELRDQVDETAERSGFAGVVRLEQAGAVPLDAAYGLADRRHEIAMTTDSQLGMASGSKTFTALVVLRLVEEGLLALSTTARQVLGAGLPLIADDVTIEHLLSHRSGIGDYLDEDAVDSEEYELPVSAHRLVTTEDFLPILDRHPAKFPAGERFSYCNGAFVVLREETLADMRTARSEPDPGESRCYGLGVWLHAGTPQITMSGADAGCRSGRAITPTRTTATVISTTMSGAWPVAEIVDAHA
ncbi:serine hydrolase domain-containing protein [Nocardioides sp.]|uniref:serine hydrolase domain-containing protein n=1 Tax=Nocardioides sp. TaxID=35761 RepID=UPI002B7F1119|nr:serine hydrolase domain-containing protein [Nocardioides sp.]HXH80648.1 serine hydrolase domain-containing protein [Nocardioides sp.]